MCQHIALLGCWAACVGRWAESWWKQPFWSMLVTEAGWKGGQGGERAQSFACVGVGVSTKVKEMTLDVGTGQEIADRDGIALVNCVSRLLLFSVLHGLGTKCQFGTQILHQFLPVSQLVLAVYVKVSATCIINGINVSSPPHPPPFFFNPFCS